VTARVRSPLNFGKLYLHSVGKYFGYPRIFLKSIEGYTLWNSHGKYCYTMVPLSGMSLQWIHHMNLVFIKGGKGKINFSQVESPGKLGVKDLEKTFQNVIRA
jgi:hypothetical protein